MLIANPLYDVVFKYLLEDMDIARELIATILGEQIVALEVKPQETVTENTLGTLSLLRFDFRATIETPSGELKKVLIELQKLKKSFNIMRFRRYLGDNYRKEDEITLADGSTGKTPLPIVTIYILGFSLDYLTQPIVKINRTYTDVLTNQPIEAVKEEFVELLTHDSFFIQVKALPPQTKTKLERVLQIFNPKFKTKDEHALDFTGNTDEPIVQKMVSRLQRAIAEEDLRRIMDAEDEIEQAFERETKKKDLIIAEKEGIIAEKNEALAEKDEALAEKDEALAEKDEALAEKDEALAEKDEVIAELMRKLNELQPPK